MPLSYEMLRRSRPGSLLSHSKFPAFFSNRVAARSCIEDDSIPSEVLVGFYVHGNDYRQPRCEKTDSTIFMSGVFEFDLGKCLHLLEQILKMKSDEK